MSETVKVQAMISLLPFRLTDVGEAESFSQILRFYDGDIDKANNGILSAKHRFNMFYENNYTPRRTKCHSLK